MYNYKMIVQYDGTRYSGWQKQGNTGATIQGKLEQAISELLNEAVELNGSGRTDAGVHAIGQTANFKTVQPIDCGRFQRKLNGILPEDIAVLDLTPAEPKFHARLSAREKTYCYTINNSGISDVFRRRFEYCLDDPLNLERMRKAAELMLGSHDFKGFSSGHTKKSTVRTIRRLDIREEDGKVKLYFVGDGFLYNMVRILTGTLIEIGLEQRDMESIITVFETKDRTKAGPTAPPKGLCLMNVSY